MQTQQIPIPKLTVQKFTGLCTTPARLLLAKNAERRIAACFGSLSSLANDGRAVYGVNTGVGSLCETVLAQKHLRDLQKNIIRSHACGTTPFLPPEAGRGAMLLSINSLAKGYSGVSVALVKFLIRIFNAGVRPLLPERGSLGASGDLIPLAHLGLLLLGRGEALFRGRTCSGSAILSRLGLRPYAFKQKEALGLINGTEACAAVAALAVAESARFSHSTLSATAALFEVLGASTSCLARELHRLKPHAGQRDVARELSEKLRGSRLCNRPHRKIQDAYVIRCAPQIEGAVRDVIHDAEHAIETELNAVTDNPLFFNRGGRIVAVSGGNFHAQRVAFAMDSLTIATAAASKLTERRIERLLNADLSGLPPFLTRKDGLRSGLMITQYLASALVAENNILASPASIHSSPVSANQEDFASMAMTAAVKCVHAIGNAEHILAIELLCLAQAMDCLREEKISFQDFSRASRALYERIRNVSKPLINDRELGEDIANITKLIRMEGL